MDTDAITKIAGYIALAAPATIALSNVAKLVMEWLKQRHSIAEAQIQQGHQITTHYLDRALDPAVPLAIRHQLLRFLATSDKAGTRLQLWAESELRRVGGILEETDRAVAVAQAELQNAKNAAEIQAAERKLADATLQRRGLLETPINPPTTAAALRAGMIDNKALAGLVMKDEDLTGAKIVYAVLRGADFSGSELADASLQGSDLRAASFVRSNLKKTVFFKADLRGADFSEARLVEVNFLQARLEGANLKTAEIVNCRLGATYDTATKWPDAFNPDAHGAILV